MIEHEGQTLRNIYIYVERVYIYKYTFTSIYIYTHYRLSHEYLISNDKICIQEILTPEKNEAPWLSRQISDSDCVPRREHRCVPRDEDCLELRKIYRGESNTSAHLPVVCSSLKYRRNIQELPGG